MMRNKENDNSIPDFCWDRQLTERDIRERLKSLQGIERDQFNAWILREAAFRDVWRFLTPHEVVDCLPWVQNSLGRWKGFWNYIITKPWHELGKM